MNSPFELGSCTEDSQCQWLFSCQENICSHVPIFPLTSIYSIFIYLLIPLASGIVNMTGNSMGVFKVLIMMNLLRYQVAQSTALIQPMVAGTAIPNFLIIIFKRHPFRRTSLVNYNIVYILIPSCLFGSTFGALMGNFVPQIAQDALIMLVFSYFTYNFVIKARKLAKEQNLSKKTQEINENQSEDAVGTTSADASLLSGSQISNMIEQTEMDPSTRRKLQIIQTYQDTMHLPDIVASFGCFIAFQALVFLVQGKLSFLKFDKCDWEYPVGISFLAIVTVVYLFLVKNFLKRNLEDYQAVDYPMDIKLTSTKKFWLVALGGLCAGFMQGIIGVGSGTCIMAVLLALDIPPIVASACSGFQIFFIGSASLIEQLINGDLIMVDIGFLVGVTAVLGGIVTFLMYKWIQKRNIAKVNQILLYIICVLCLISVVGVIPSVITTVNSFGWDELLKIKWNC